MAVMTSAETAGQPIGALPAGRYRIDPEKSTVTFTTRHLFGLAPVRGTFALRDGVVSVADPVTESAVGARIAAPSFHTGNVARDATVLSRKLLDAETYPSLTFSSTELTQADGEWALRGEFEVRGVTRLVEARIGAVSEHDGTLHATARVRIDRYDFGLTAFRGLAARTLTIDLGITARREAQS
jgi:polyisoprenoid-binding protein YceI